MHSQAVSPSNITSSSTQQQREPPPYPGYNNFSTPGYRQSFSGSETSTDYSLSSTENLSTSARQDPPGEETTAPGFTPPPLSLGDYSILTRLGYPECCSTTNGLKSTGSFYSAGSTFGESVPCQDSMPVTVDSNYFMPSAMGGGTVFTTYADTLGYENSVITTMGNILTSNSGVYSFNNNCEQQTKGCSSTQFGFDARTSAYTVCPGESNVYSTWSQETHPQTQTNTTMDVLPQADHQTTSSQPQPQPSRRQAHSPASMLHHYVNEAMVIEQQQEQQSSENLSELHRQLSTGSSQSQSVGFESPQSTLGHERLIPPSSLQQPQSKQSPLAAFGLANQCQSSPSSPSSLTNRRELRRSFERLDFAPLTHSQPDLTRLADVHGTLVPFDPVDFSKDNNVHKDFSQSVARKLELDHAAVATCTRATQMVEKLAEENSKLHKELEFVYKKVSKLQKVEIEVERLTEAYEGLVRQSQKRETLEKLMRLQMEAQMKKVKSINNELKDQLNKALSRLQQNDVYNLTDSELKLELSRKDNIIAKLISQSNDVSNAKDRMEIEAAATRATLQEQKAHIDILDKALTNAQTSVLKYEEELHHRETCESHISELQMALSQYKAAGERREAIELTLRTNLEEQLKSLKNQKCGSKISDTDEGISSDSESPTSVQSLIRQLQEREERNLELENQVAKWEQKYLEETALRHMAVEAASTPKDARIAALERSSVETERIIAEARTDRLKHLEEVYHANRKCAQLEARENTLQAQLAEKDAMIKVLLHQPALSRTGSMVSLYGSPSHSPTPSLMPSLASASITPSSLLSQTSSRRESQLDLSGLRNTDVKLPFHSKSNSTGSHTFSSLVKELQLKEIQLKLAQQACSKDSIPDADHLSKRLWQV